MAYPLAKPNADAAEADRAASISRTDLPKAPANLSPVPGGFFQKDACTQQNQAFQ